ncbi:hypothetical protein [Allohahella sp. A8]|uniref:hypothetical protein n=1 Tax=Allohahella sp. A8 TaxID=3141461 RepID=UPI003A80B71D
MHRPSGSATEHASTIADPETAIGDHEHRSVEAAVPAWSDTGPDSLSALASQLLIEYEAHEFNPEAKQAMRALLRSIIDSDDGRALIATLFFSSVNPAIAASIYDLILDADLKDPTLIVTLIERDQTEFEVEFKMRLIDLIADLNTSHISPYSVEIDEFLAEMAVHPDQGLQDAAAAQWAWYVSRHKGIVPVLNSYLFSHGRQTRAEIYEMIELEAVTDAAEKREVASALEALIHADYLKIQAEELDKVRTLIARLSVE